MRSICTAVVAMLALVGTSFAATINVPSDYATIQGAIDASVNGDVINIAPGTYNEYDLNPNGKAITIQGTLDGDGSLATTIDAQQGDSVFVCYLGEGDGTVIKDLVITGGLSSYGGGIYCYSSDPTITNCTISGNAAEYFGGGIYCSASSPTITGCTISGNTAGAWGGGLVGACGGVDCQYPSNPTITGCTISGNTASGGGGGIYCDYFDFGYSSSTLIDTNVCGNVPDQISGSWSNGGGVCVWFYCTDSDDDGIIDVCDDQIGDGIHEVPGEFVSIQEAVALANDGDTVLVAPGTYTGTGDWVINPGGKPITIRATGDAEETILDGEGARRVVQCTSGESSDTVIEGFTITGGSAHDGGGIYCSNSSPTITGCTISGNQADYGGGIYCSNSSPTITGCTITNNTANDDGGGISCSGSSPTITDCTITNNMANLDGGGIYCNSNSSPTITDCTMTDNAANSSGGGIYCNSNSSPTITGCTIESNTASDGGGGIYCSNSNLTLINTKVCGNDHDQIYGSWTDGGGVCIAFSCDDWDGNGVPDKCDGSIDDGIHEVPSEYATIQEAIEVAGFGDTVLVGPGTYTGTGNWVINPSGKPITIIATGSAEETILDGEGARRVVQCTSGESADTVIEGFTITGGSAANGGGISCTNNSSPTITDCTITNNMANDDGGGIYCNSNSSPTITGCTIESNTASDAGGGISCTNNSSPTITNCTITNNMANDDGGGIYCSNSSPTITDCTITNNMANDDGGGIYCSNSSPTITGCTISGNTASGYNGQGGGIYCSNSSPTITDCTITNNMANDDGGSGQGGGIYCSNSSPTITGCTITNNTANDDGGGIYCNGSSPTITDCVITGNIANSIGGGVCVSNQDGPLLTDTAVCSNLPNQITGAYSDEGGNTVAAICPVPGACCTNGECVMAEQADCLAFHGTWLGEDTTCDDTPCPIACFSDVTGDGKVSTNDLLTVIANWGPCP